MAHAQFFGFIYHFPSLDVHSNVVKILWRACTLGFYLDSDVLTTFTLASIVSNVMEFNEVHCALVLVPPIEVEFVLLPP